MSKNLPYDRAERVGDEIYQLISSTVVMNLSDPRLNGVSITRVLMTPDLRVARVLYHLDMGTTAEATEDDKERAVKGLESASGQLKRRIGEELNLRFMPQLKYYYDQAVDTQEKMEELFKQIKGK